MPVKKDPRNSVGLAGEFTVTSQLVILGFNAEMTISNTIQIDICA